MKLRIVKSKNETFHVQRKYLGIFWVDFYNKVTFSTLEGALSNIQHIKRKEQFTKNLNTKIVVWEDK